MISPRWRSESVGEMSFSVTGMFTMSPARTTARSGTASGFANWVSVPATITRIVPVEVPVELATS